MSNSSRYAQVGVDIDAGDRVKKRIAELTRKTFTPNVLHKDGAFGAMFSLDTANMTKPVLVSSVDGVGTKVKVAIAYGKHRGIGQDLVNHCIDDLLPSGAKPLFFLDYFACGKQNDDVVLQLIEGMSQACAEANMALIGGETAQMPDVYSEDEYDLAGTIVGVVDEINIIQSTQIKPGDIIMGIPSSGLHTNGYTLARNALLNEAKYSLHDQPESLNQPIGDELLIPHRSYLREIMSIKDEMNIHGIAHITGGGFQGNISRILPDHCKAIINCQSWTPQPIFKLIQEKGSISNQEMYRVFNMGIGLCVIIPKEAQETFMAKVKDAVLIGEIVEGQGVELLY